MCVRKTFARIFVLLRIYTISMLNFYLFEVKWIFVFLWDIFEYLFHWNNTYVLLMQSIVYFFTAVNTEDARCCRNANFFSKTLIKTSILKDTFFLHVCWLLFSVHLFIVYTYLNIFLCNLLQLEADIWPSAHINYEKSERNTINCWYLQLNLFLIQTQNKEV